LRALSVVRAVVAGVGHGAVVRGCGEGTCFGGAQAKDGPARRGASAAAAEGRSVSADLGAEPGSAGCAAIAGASAQASAVADTHEESAAIDGAELRGTEKVQAVDQGRASGVGTVAFAAVRGRAAKTVAGSARRAGSGDQRTRPAGGRRSAAEAGGGVVDDASGSGIGDGVGDGADAGTGRKVRIGEAGGQLLRPDSE